jgi:hypothetical protein
VKYISIKLLIFKNQKPISFFNGLLGAALEDGNIKTTTATTTKIPKPNHTKRSHSPRMLNLSPAVPASFSVLCADAQQYQLFCILN